MLPEARSPHELDAPARISLDGLIKQNGHVAKAYNRCVEAHDGVGQKRANNEPYHTHPFAVAQIIVEEWGLESNIPLIQGAFLHDTAEDTNYTLEQTRVDFGDNVAYLVNGVSALKTKSTDPLDKKIADQETIQKVARESFLDPRVLLIKLADRLHNMRTLGFISNPLKRKLKAQETLDSYVPMAESLGLWKVKKELEDLSFRHIEPVIYAQIKEKIDNDPRLDPLFIENVVSSLRYLITSSRIKGDVSITRSGYWEMLEKMRKAAAKGEGEHDSFQRVNDLISIRVTFETWPECYQFIGSVHERFGESVDYSRYDEYVGANASINSYEAIQTTLMYPNRGAVEIAITTVKAESFNAWGIISTLKNGEEDLSDYVRKIVFTPTGQALFTSQQATGVDIAYSLNPMAAADVTNIIVDGNKMQVSTVIPHGSIVELEFGPSKRAPDSSWLQFCLPSTRQLIEQQIIKQKKDDLIRVGSLAVEELLTTLGLPNLEDLSGMRTKLFYRLNCGTVEDLYYLVGSGSLSQADLEKTLIQSGLTTDLLKLTTIRISGIDQPGIFGDIASLVSKEGGNIITLKLDNNDKPKFKLRIVAENLSPESVTLIRQIVLADNRFETSNVS